MATASSMAELPDLRHSGLDFLLDPIDRLPLIEVTGGVDQLDPLVLTAVGPSAVAHADSLCGVAAGQHGGSAEQIDSGRKRKQPPTESFESTRELHQDGHCRCGTEGIHRKSVFLCLNP
ncbi:uncharacterized protein LOC119317174 [Triticum dicoccoides]|uniref:uncharacterized protein LOC119317174 n=1 Tax=Triticum dicoccoides TaxID=85692 RepID=UPI001891664E|nr:uncharacterized protein LOC119317174 [Triticum dicoccoides]